MELAEIMQDIHHLGHELERLERKYGSMSETFYAAYVAGDEPEDDNWVGDFAMWAGLYEVWRDRRAAYEAAVERLRPDEPSVFKMIQPASA